MIIDFAVSNYRSIKDEVVLSAVAQAHRSTPPAEGSKRRIRPDNEIAAPYLVEGRGIELLPVLAIFGANASGKSNVVRALDTLLSLMDQGSGEGGKRLKQIQPFGLEPSFLIEPTCFDLRVALEGFVYSYALGLNRERILWERLNYTPPPPARSRKLYARHWDESTERTTWENGDSFLGPHVQLQDSLEDHEPYISLLQRVKVERVQRLTQWLADRWPGLSLGNEQIDRLVASLMSHDSQELRSRVARLIRSFDTGLRDIRSILSDDPSEEKSRGVRVRAVHDTPHGEVQWNFNEESLGTQNLYVLAHRMLDAFGRETPVIVDELEAHLHPHVIRAIINLFQNPKTNPTRAQLIFTSHNNQLQRLLRRDQIWFTEKCPDGSTRLYPLSDFKVRNDLAIDEGYLDGRFGAVPVLPSEEALMLTENVGG